MKKALALIKISITDAFAYRGDVFLFTIGGISQTMATMLVWVVISGSSASSPLSSAQFIQYYLLTLIIKLWTGAWADVFIASDIRTGKLSNFLLKPFAYINYQLGNNFGEKVVKTLYLIPVIALLVLFTGVFIPHLTPVQQITILISWLMAYGVTFLVDICTGLVGFWFSDVRSIHEGVMILTYTLSGQLIPVFLLPGLVQKINFFLPFRYMISLPVEIALNKVSGQALFASLSIQALWLLILVYLYRRLWTRGLKQYSAFGA